MVLVREERGLVAAGAAMSAASSGANGFGSAFVQPVGEDCFGMRRGPAVGQHLLETQVVGMQAEK